MRRIVVGPSGVWVTVMRFLVLPILAVGAVYAAAPLQAQTYDPNYPICLQIYDDMVHYYFECRLYIDGSMSGVQGLPHPFNVPPRWNGETTSR